MSFFRPATKKKSRLRMAIDGPSGSGKTYTALRFACAQGGRVAVLNSESGAVEKYLGESPDGTPWQFDVGELPDYSPSRYTACILEAGKAGYEWLIIDSLSHAWDGMGGALELVDKKGGNKFTAWKDVTPLHRRMIEAILRSTCHVIVTMRSKMEYILEQDQNGKQVPRKVGMAPVQRAGMEYEFDLVCDMDWTHQLTVSKSRCNHMDGASAVKPGPEFFAPLMQWLNEGIDDPSQFTTDEASLISVPAQPPAAAKESAAPSDPMAMLRAAAEAAEQTQQQTQQVELASVDQQGLILSYCGQLGWDHEKQLKLRQKLYDGVASWGQLTVSQADDLIKRLEVQVRHKAAEFAAKTLADKLAEQAPGPLATPPAATPPQSAFSERVDSARCGDDQWQQIVTLLREITDHPGHADMAKKLREKLGIKPSDSIRDALTRPKADGLIKSLMKKSAELRFSSKPAPVQGGQEEVPFELTTGQQSSTG